jgi:hypothetical protein
MARAGFAMGCRNQLAQDATFVLGVVLRTLGAQNGELFLQRLQTRDARSHTFDLLINQFINVDACATGQRREVQQAPDVGHGNVQGTTVPHERKTLQVPRPIAAVAIGETVGQVNQARAFIEPDCPYLHARGLAQVTDFHPMAFIAV